MDIHVESQHLNFSSEKEEREAAPLPHYANSYFFFYVWMSNVPDQYHYHHLPLFQCYSPNTPSVMKRGLTLPSSSSVKTPTQYFSP